MSPPGTSHFGFFHPLEWRDSVLSAPQVPCGLAGLPSFSPQDTLGTGSSGMTGTGESLSPEDWDQPFSTLLEVVF